MGAQLKHLTRRGLLALLARASLCLSWLGSLPLASSAVAQETATRGGAPLADVLRQLLPHAGLDEAFYRETAAAISLALAGSPQQQLLVRLLARLDGAAGAGGWREAGPGARQAALRSVESDPFFPALLTAAVELVYRDPRVWKIIGYGGNALAQGGYLHRGFNDISWLPREQG